MTDTTTLLRQALDMLGPGGNLTGWTGWHYDALCAALAAQPAPVPVEPVAWRWRERPHESRAWGDWRHVGHTPQGLITALFQAEPLYAHPPAQPAPVPLTDEQLRNIARALPYGGDRLIATIWQTAKLFARDIQLYHGIAPGATK